MAAGGGACERGRGASQLLNGAGEPAKMGYSLEQLGSDARAAMDKDDGRAASPQPAARSPQPAATPAARAAARTQPLNLQL